MNIRYFKYIFRTFIALFLIGFFSVKIQAQGAFPEGDGRDKVFVACVQCHGLGHLTRVSLDAEQWENAVYDMVARGAVIDIDDLDSIKNYLINNFANDK